MIAFNFNFNKTGFNLETKKKDIFIFYNTILEIYL